MEQLVHIRFYTINHDDQSLGLRLAQDLQKKKRICGSNATLQRFQLKSELLVKVFFFFCQTNRNLLGSIRTPTRNTRELSANSPGRVRAMLRARHLLVNNMNANGSLVRLFAK